VPFAENALHIGPHLVEQFSPEAIAVQIAYHLSRITGASHEAAHFGVQPPEADA